MKRYLISFIFLLLTVSFLSFIEAKGKEPVRTSMRWGDDVVVDFFIDGYVVCLEADNSTGNLFSLIPYYAVEFGWGLYVSLDTGKTWGRRYVWAYASSVPDDMGSVVMGDYFYTVVPWDYGETIHRFSTSSGIYDSTYDDSTAIVIGSEEEIDIANRELASSQTYSTPRLYYYGVENNDSLLFYWSEDSGKTWVPDHSGIGDIGGGLDVCGNEGGLSEETWCCYKGENDSLYAASRSDSLWTYYGPFDYIVDAPSIDAYKDTVIIVYPSRVGADSNYIKYVVSYNGGSDWVFGVLYGPSAVGIDKSDVTAGDGYGFGVIYVIGGEGFYRHKNPFDESWSEPVSFADTVPLTSVAIEEIVNGVYGIIYVVNHGGMHGVEVRFDRSDWISGIEEESVSGDGLFLIGANPSVFTSRTSIEYILGAKQNISLDVYDILGNHVVNLANGEVSAGENSAVWDGKDASGNPVASGMYFCVLKANEKRCVSQKITLIK